MANKRRPESPRNRRKPENPGERVRQHYAELHRMASQRLGQLNPHPTLQTTELVDEAYIRLAENGPEKYLSRAHFFGSAKRAMRATVVDRFRRSGAKKRGGDYQKLALDDACSESAPPPGEFQALRDALSRLNAFDPYLGRIVKLRYFEGFSTSEIAGALKRGKSTIRRDWTIAKAWLQRELVARNFVR